MEKPDHHQVRPSGAWEFAEADQSAQEEGGWDRCLIHELGDFGVRRLRNAELNRKGREEFVDKVNASERDEKACPQFRHEVRSVEDVKRLEEPQADQNVSGENSQNVSSTDFQDSGPRLPNREEKSDGQKQDREGAGIDAVNQGGNADKRQ